MAGRSTESPEPGGAQVPEWAVAWSVIDDLLGRLDVPLTCAHGLGPLAAYRRRTLGQEIPEQLRREERAAATANLVAPALLGKARAAYDGTLLVLKGPEITTLYPGRARRFGDLDLLPADADKAQAALLAAGFRLQDRDWPPEGFDDVQRPHYHLHPLEWPGLALRVEIHKQVKWPEGLKAPANDEFFEAAVPSVVGIDGLLAPSRQHHAVLLAAHAWGEVPMRHIRELIDALLFVPDADRDELARMAERWNFRRGWETTLSVADWLLRDGPTPAAVRLWARYLRGLREPTVLEMHVQEWLAPFWMAPPPRAAQIALAAFVRDLRPYPDQTWGDKGKQTVRAIMHPLSPRSEHDQRSGRLRTPH
jgi:hypothetical protein